MFQHFPESFSHEISHDLDASTCAVLITKIAHLTPFERFCDMFSCSTFVYRNLLLILETRALLLQADTDIANVDCVTQLRFSVVLAANTICQLTPSAFVLNY